MRAPLAAAALLCTLAAACGPAGAPAPSAPAAAAPASADPPPAGAYGTCEATPDGTGATYFGREIAHFMTHHGIPWLERDSREAEERTSALLDALGLRPSMCVADIGAGSGRLTVPIARRMFGELHD